MSLSMSMRACESEGVCVMFNEFCIEIIQV